MKILQINKFYYLRGGSERYVFELSKILKENGHEVIPFSMADERNQDSKYSQYFADNVDVKKISLKNIIKTFYNYDAVKKLNLLLDKTKPDIAHLHNISHHLSPAIITVLKKRDIPIVQTLHDYKLICPNRQLFFENKFCDRCQGGKYYNCFLQGCIQGSRLKSFLGALEAYIHNRILKTYDKIDLFIAPSRFMRDICVQFGIPKEKIKVIYNFTLPPPSMKDKKTKEEKDINSKYLLYFGRLSSEKGIDTLIKALPMAKNKINLKIVGGGPEYKNLEKLIIDLKLGSSVKLLGPKYRDKLQALINKAEGVVMPSIWPENMPLSLLESMAAGKVVIAARTGGMPELIQDKVNGFLFHPGNIRDLAEKIDKLAEINLLAMQRNSFKSVQKFNQADHYKKVFNYYRAVYIKERGVN